MTEQENLYSTTNTIFKINIFPAFLEEQSSNINNIYYWAYKIDIDNISDAPMQITNYYWKVIDSNGMILNVKGKNIIVGKVIIKAGDSFSYHNTIQLNTPSGFVIGCYKIKNLETDKFSYISTPAFSLDSPYDTHLPS